MQLEFWDTAGQERHRQALHITYYRNADAVILVYDVTNLKSFENLQYWLSECKRFVAEDIPYVLIGNKCDQDAMVSRAAAQRFADTNGMLVSLLNVLICLLYLLRFIRVSHEWCLMKITVFIVPRNT